jgi:hypothetical protein
VILHVNPDSSALVRGTAELVLIAHITGGGVGLLSGAVALLSRKGARLHRTTGNVFFVAMLIMSAIGGSVAPLLPQRSSVVPAILTFYLVATGWMTVRRKEGGIGLFELGALLVALGAAATGVMFGLQAVNSPTGLLDGQDPSTYYVFAAIVAFAAAMDVGVIWRGGVSGAQRIARHVWRMCVALLIAAISFFLGQQQVFPASLRDSPILFAPEIAILGLMIFWLLRVRLTGRFEKNAIVS